MASNSTGYTIGFATAVCVLCGIGVASSNVALKERQDDNKRLDQQKQVLLVAGLLQPGQEASSAAISDLFEKNIRPEVIDLKTGQTAKGVSPAGFDMLRAQKDPATSQVAPPNAAKVLRLPNNALVYHVVKDGKTETLILPIQGYGLWSMLYGYLAVANDANTVKGITYYQHAETPGLGGEVDNPKWKALWPGRKLYDEQGKEALRIIKGRAGDPKTDPYQIDGLSGATITSNGVSNTLQFWFGPDGFTPFLKRFKASPTPPAGGGK
ncbi:MAG: Na(+)-translocating NADH-quinone reductase subunit C [Myxococcales bacterium]|nr:Na(+)-translocating NADH-quinone reductase subunit C [Myxococcales bacterium]